MDRSNSQARSNSQQPPARRHWRTALLLAASAGISFGLQFSSPRSAFAAAGSEPSVSALITDLSADDATARQNASDKLVALGRAARPAILAAVHSDDPQASAQAAQILLKLPWANPDDPPPVKEILDKYANYMPPEAPQASVAGGEDNRKAAAIALAQIPDYAGLDALVRLINEDPSNSVRWFIERTIRTSTELDHYIKFRRTDAPPDDPALAALYGVAWMTAGSPQADKLFTQALEEEFASPDDDDGEVSFMVDYLVDSDIEQRKFDDAAVLLRREIKRGATADRQGVPLPLLRLLALQVEHGPLKDLDSDRKIAADYAQSAKILYANAHIATLLNHPDDADTARRAAFNANAASRLGRFETAKYLSDSEWNDDAETEFKAYLAMPLGDDAGDDNASEANAHFELATLAARRGNDQLAADEKKNAMSIIGGGPNIGLIRTDGRGRTWPAKEDEIWAEIHWRYLLAANKAGDTAAIDKELDEIMKLSPIDEDIATDVIPILKQRKRMSDAAQLFTATISPDQAKLKADPGNPIYMNSIAWLDARCDENLPEALKLATGAVAALPDSAAFIDTLAEVNYHLGNYPKSVELETRALQLNPGDDFMTGQLAKFKAGASNAKPN